MVSHERTARAALLPVWSKHEVLDDQLVSPREEVRKGHLAARCVEDVVLLDLHPRQLAPFGAQLVAQAGAFLFLLQQLLASCDPFLLRNYLVVSLRCLRCRYICSCAHDHLLGLAGPAAAGPAVLVL